MICMKMLMDLWTLDEVFDFVDGQIQKGSCE